MQTRTVADKPPLLLLSHCVPDPFGHADRARAWQLLRLCSQTHSVALACIQDGPVSLPQWRHINARTTQFAIVPRRRRRRLAGSLISLYNHAVANCLSYSNALAIPMTWWIARQRFEIALATAPVLWPELLHVDAERRLCDVRGPISRNYESWALSAFVAAPGWLAHPLARWRWRQARHYQHLEQQIAQTADALLVDRPSVARAFERRARRTLVLPHAIDLEAFASLREDHPFSVSPQSSHPRLVLHTDWRHPHARQMERFVRLVWREVRQAVPQATLVQSGPAEPIRRNPAALPATTTTNNLRSLFDATVVLSPTGDPDIHRWPILQAMALQRPVIAVGEQMDGLDANHGEHLVFARTPEEAADWAIQSLRQEDVRLRLAEGAHGYIASQQRQVDLETLTGNDDQLRQAA